MAKPLSIHPQVDQGIKPAATGFTGGTLVCHCSDKKVTVSIGGQVADAVEGRTSSEASASIVRRMKRS